MAGSPTFAHIKADVLAIIAALPRGKVTSPTVIGVSLGVMPRHIATILANLDDEERDRVPWYRVVADGGAIGRHRHRDEQIARLRADGLPVSAAGIVGGMEAAMLANLPKPRPGAPARTTSAATRNVEEKSAAADGSDEATVEPPRSSRARGRFDRPATKLR